LVSFIGDEGSLKDILLMLSVLGSSVLLWVLATIPLLLPSSSFVKLSWVWEAVVKYSALLSSG